MTLKTSDHALAPRVHHASLRHTAKEYYAIVVGIDGYRGLRPLHSAREDATRIFEWLIDPQRGALRKKNVRIILAPERMPLDVFRGRPVKNDIDKALRDFGAETKQHIGRRLYFYFAGHGVGPTFDEVAMLMADAGVKALNSNMGLRPYREYFRDSGLFDEVVYVLDCCRDPSRSVVGMPPRFQTPKSDSPPDVQDFVVLAAAFGARAYDPEDPEDGERRGILTKALLEGLHGEAEDAEGRVTSSSLRIFVLKRVPELAADAQLDQKPDISELPYPDFVFSQRSVPRTLRIRIVVPAGLCGEIVLSHGTGMQEVARRPAAEAVITAPPWYVKLTSNSPYIITHVPSIRSTILDSTKCSDGDIYYFSPHV